MNKYTVTYITDAQETVIFTVWDCGTEEEAIRRTSPGLKFEAHCVGSPIEIVVRQIA
jgi:hypothetical protein